MYNNLYSWHSHNTTDALVDLVYSTHYDMNAQDLVHSNRKPSDIMLYLIQTQSDLVHDG